MVFPDGKILSQSLAIMEYLEQLYPERSAWPSDPWERALVRRESPPKECLDGDD